MYPDNEYEPKHVRDMVNVKYWNVRNLIKYV